MHVNRSQSSQLAVLAHVPMMLFIQVTRVCMAFIGVQLASGEQVDKSRPFDAAQFTISATRLTEKPIIRTEMLPKDIGGNINGPSLIRVPEWVAKPLGKYYLYFAHHRGKYIRMAYADKLEGPWQIYQHGVLQMKDTPFGDGELPRGWFWQGPVSHIASPDVVVDDQNKRLRMYFHGLGSKRPDCHCTAVAESSDGLTFHSTGEEVILEDTYLRVVEYNDRWYGLARGGALFRVINQGRSNRFEKRYSNFPNLGEGVGIRHLALKATGDVLLVFHSCIGDAPERIRVSAVRLGPEWDTEKNWLATDPMEVLKPKSAWEGADLPIKVSTIGGLDDGQRLHELRDPAIFTEGQDDYLLYSIAGESGIGIARLVIGRQGE